MITGGDLKLKYKAGDVLNLTCTSAPSNPPATLEWILNDKPVSYSNTVEPRNSAHFGKPEIVHYYGVLRHVASHFLAKFKHGIDKFSLI